ncbi:PREDICTED: vacuolar protein sorting-associated protein 51 homolog [Chaetura pelagica]|uniref:vacuolar protein sorting-associated protein 51 homolog n=1 Tax=Chaetura pelagica TaxID=8897 RepID=UPI0005239EBD|nr:PREDICTED: vacuolar protein sorting-associated protein 51 homolog [Chaetura pelagica]
MARNDSDFLSVTGLLSGSVKRFSGMARSGRDNRRLLCSVSAGLIVVFFILYYLVDDTLDPKELTECVEMLLQLEEPPEELCEEFLSQAGARLEAELAALEAELPEPDPSGGEFCVAAVREGLVVAFVRWLCRTARGFADGPAERGAPAAPPALLLLLARFCLDYEATTISYILTLTDEQFPPQDTDAGVTPGPALCAEARGAAQRLLDHYVQAQGGGVGPEPPPSEGVTGVVPQVGQLFEEGVRRAQSSDSSRRAFSVYSSSRAPGRYAPSYTPSAPMDTHLLSNIQKLFSERIDIFSPVEFNKVSVLTGIIKISLKTLLECVRLRTLGRFGLQQVQVDGHYLQLYLWRFAADERVVQGLLDEVAASAVHRCLDPVPMEHSVVELICERG